MLYTLKSTAVDIINTRNGCSGGEMSIQKHYNVYSLRFDIGCYEWIAELPEEEAHSLYDLFTECQPIDFEKDIAAWKVFEFQG